VPLLEGQWVGLVEGALVAQVRGHGTAGGPGHRVLGDTHERGERPAVERGRPGQRVEGERVQPLGVGLPAESSDGVEVGVDRRQPLEVTHRDHQERETGRRAGEGQVGSHLRERRLLEAECVCDAPPVQVDRVDRRRGLGEPDGPVGVDVDCEHARVRLDGGSAGGDDPAVVQRPECRDRGVSTEVDLPFGREIAELPVGCLARPDERGLARTQFRRDRPHLVVGQAGRVGHHARGITGHRLPGKRVDQVDASRVGVRISVGVGVGSGHTRPRTTAVLIPRTRGVDILTFINSVSSKLREDLCPSRPNDRTRWQKQCSYRSVKRTDRGSKNW